MTILESIRQPRDLKALSETELRELSEEIREFLVQAVARTGGHLGPNLGVVELTLALHRVFASPADRILWDTGHQSYVHKLVTGRQDFSKLRGKGGLSGYPSREESEHDVIENSHASTALGWADGLAKARQVRGEEGHVVAVIGDGALTGGMAWEALNNIAAARDRPLIIVVNDNERSYAPTIGGLADHLATLRTTDGYEKVLAWGKDVLLRTPVVGATVYESLHGAKKGFKDAFAPQGMFEDLGLKYVGPIDGHDIGAVESALRRAKRFHGPVLVHCLTEKGRGYEPALAHEEDHFHTVGAMDPRTCEPLTPAAGPSWTSVFGEEIVRIAEERDDVVALTAAMLHPVGLGPFAARFPDRVWDVGIAEQHATVSAAGLATGGLHPVVAVYATFLNRAFDQLLMDVALHRCGVTFVLDRAGVTGVDGPSHNGMWDMSVLQVVPGLRIAAPRDADQLRLQLREAVAVDDAPTLVRFPKESVGPAVPALDRVGGLDVLHRAERPEVLLVAVGVMAPVCLQAADLLRARGIGCTVVDPRWVKPVDPALPHLAAEHRLVAVVEDNSRAAGVGSAVALALGDAEVDVPVRRFGIPEQFLAHAKRGEVLADIGLTPVEIAGRISASLALRADGTDGAPPARAPSHTPRRSSPPPTRSPPRRPTHDHRGIRVPVLLVAVGGARGFDLGALLAERGAERYALHSKYLNPQLPRMLHTIGFDKVYERAEGAHFFDAEGHDHLDMLAGFGVMGLGRHHPVVRRALHDVLDLSLADLTRFDCQPLPGLLAEKLLTHSPHLDRVFFGNSGTEAVETALKFARYATGRPRVLYCEHAFHGLTTGSLSVNGESGFRDGFAPLLPDTAVPLGDLDALARELRKGDVAALIVEPIQGKGVHEAPPGYLRAAQELLHRHKALLIADEVQTGLGRTGDFYAYQHEEGVEPDLVCVAKALSGGYVPVGATLGRDWIFKKVYSSMDRVLVHSASFGSNAQAMAAGLAVLAVMENEQVVAHARAVGERLKSRLTALTDEYELLADVRGRGLMIGIEFGRPASLKLRSRWAMLQAARKGLFAQMVVVPLLQRHRILTQVSGDHLEVIKLIPPLVITDQDADRFVEAFTDVMDDAHTGGGLMWDFGRTLIKQAVAHR